MLHIFIAGGHTFRLFTCVLQQQKKTFANIKHKQMLRGYRLLLMPFDRILIKYCKHQSRLSPLDRKTSPFDYKPSVY